MVVRDVEEVLLDLVHDIKRALEATGVDVRGVQSQQREKMAECVMLWLPELVQAKLAEPKIRMLG